MSRTEQARAILAANDRGGYTVPTDRLYPFQWNWDSAFVAMGWATFDADHCERLPAAGLSSLSVNQRSTLPGSSHHMQLFKASIPDSDFACQ